MATSQASVLKLYLSVVEDVISGVRECFLDEGVDEQVLQELKQSWESKLHSNKALEQNDAAEGYSNVRGGLKLANTKKNTNDIGDGGANVGVLYTDDVRTEKMYPVQITLPPQQNTGETTPRVLTIQVPESAIAGNQLQQVLTGPLIGATLALPTHLATTLIQQHVTAALRGQQTGSLISSRTFQQNNPAQLDGANDECPDFIWKVLPSSSSSSQASGSGSNTAVSIGKVSWPAMQVDGGMDSSDEDDEDEDDDDDDIDGDDPDGDGDENEGDEGAEEEPLNSSDDVSEEDVTDLFDTENVVVCQYDKITRSRNKWKFHLKDGVMNLQGKDFVFQKSNGDAEW